MMVPAEIGETIKMVVGVASAALGGVFVAIGFLFRLAYRLGGDAKKISDGLDRLKKIEDHIQEIPVIRVRMGTLEEAWKTTRSDIKHLLRGSRPDFPPNGEDR